MVEAGCLDDELVAAHLAETLPPDRAQQVSVHLASCESCQRRVHDVSAGHAREGESSRKPTASAAACPSATTLSELVCRQLPARRADEVEAHIADCAMCRRVVGTLAAASLPSLSRANESGASEIAGPSRRHAVSLELPRGATIDRYVVLGVAGRGGGGIVYAAYDPKLDRKVALKLLGIAWEAELPDGRARLLREARAMAQLSHPNVVTVHDIGELEGQVFVAMEFVEGGTLRAWLAERRPWREVVRMFVQAGHGLVAAHALGLVHRDFKPDNVLVGKDGRARVSDFGLVRAHEVEPKRPSVEAIVEALPTRETQLTRTGTIMGTPYYMAPEQHLGLAVDARTDQFAFCAALYEGLFGVRAFAGETLTELAQAVTQGRVREPPPGTEVPATIRRAILRGLAPTPDDRHPALDDALAELRRAVRPRRRMVWLGVAAATVAAASVVIVELSTAREPPACVVPTARLENVWDAPTRIAVQNAFTATKVAYARDAFDRAAQRLDAYATQWSNMHQQTCAATNLRHEQSEQLLDLRMHCLDRRLAELVAFTTSLREADAKVVEHAVEGANGLRPIEACADTRALTAAYPLPEDLPARAAVEDASRRVDRAEVLARAGHYGESRKQIEENLAAIGHLEFPPLRARALVLLANLGQQLGDLGTAERAASESVEAAAAARDDVLLARAWTQYASVVGYQQARTEEAQRWLRAAAIAATRAADDDVHAELEAAHAQILVRAGDYAGSLEHADRAYGSLRSRYGDRDLRVVEALKAKALALFWKGEFGACREAYEHALNVTEELLGRSHPALGRVLMNLGACLERAGRDEEAETVLRRGLDLLSTAAPDSPSRTILANNLAEVAMKRHDYTQAEHYLQDGLRIEEAARGSDHPNVAILLATMGEVYMAEGKRDLARPQFQRALEIREHKLGAEHPLLRGPLVGLGEILLDTGRPREAVPLLERAVAVSGGTAVDQRLAATTRFALARALVDARLDRVRAMSLAHEAERKLITVGEPGARDLERVRQWIAAQPATSSQAGGSNLAK
jgi:tetratricopeptide (TPR) repeat protein